MENIKNVSTNLSDMVSKRIGNLTKMNIDEKSMDMEKNKQQFSLKNILDSFIEKNKEKFYEKLRFKWSLKKIILCKLMWGEEESKSMGDCLHCQLTDKHDKVILVLEDWSSNDNKCKEVYVMCDNVICTMSLGFLKEHLNDLFIPKQTIINERRESIEKLGYGTFNKIFLSYDKPFWNKNFSSLHMIFLPKTKEDMDYQLSCQHSDQYWYRDLSSFRLLQSEKNVLWTSIYNNENFEKLNDKEVSQKCTKMLRKFLNQNDIPEPKSIEKTNWFSDPFIRGSNTYLSSDSSSQDIINIAKPIILNNVPLVLFSGEATHVENFSTILGAYLAGLRESNRILNAHKETETRPKEQIG